MMKRTVYFLVLCLLLVLLPGCTANRSMPANLVIGTLPPVVAPAQAENGKFGYIDISGQWVIQPAFEKTEAFSQGLAAVKQNGKWGYIDREGQWAIQPRFVAAMPFSEGMAAVYIQRGDTVDEWFIDQNGKRKFKLKLSSGDWYTDFHDGLLRVYRDGKFGFLDKNGRTAIDFIYKQADDFIEGRSMVANEDEMMGYIRTDGSALVPLQYAYITPFSGGIMAGREPRGADMYERQSSIYNEQGELVYQIQGFVDDLQDGYALIRQTIKLSDSSSTWGYGLIDRLGNVVVDPQKSYCSLYGEIVNVEDIVINAETQSRDYTNSRYTDISGKLLFYQDDLKENLPFSFHEAFDSIYISRVRNGFIIATLGDDLTEDKSVLYADQKWQRYHAVYDLAGKPVMFTAAMDSVYFYEQDTLVGWREEDQTYLFVDKSGAVTERKLDSFVFEYHYSLCAAKENGKWGYLDPKGQFVIAPQFLWAGAFGAVE